MARLAQAKSDLCGRQRDWGCFAAVIGIRKQKILATVQGRRARENYSVFGADAKAAGQDEARLLACPRDRAALEFGLRRPLQAGTPFGNVRANKTIDPLSFGDSVTVRLKSGSKS
jgi:hypothetical protein